MSDTRHDIQQLIAATGKYKILCENTEGANAYAFRAHHIPLNQLVFLKVLVPDPSGELFAEPRWLIEATKVESGENNLVRVHDAQRLGDAFILVAMEFVEGGSMLSRLADGPLPMMEAIGAAIGILHGLAQLHQALLVHRDIKPGNVLLSQRYGRIWSKITDFGSVARLSHVGATVTASRHSALYVPPEGWATPGHYDVRSDLYQVGVVLYEMVHGALPYDDADYIDREARREVRDLGASSLDDLGSFERCQVVNRALARAARTKGVIAFGQALPYVPRALSRVINKAVAPNPLARYQTPSEMIGDLELLQLPDWQRANSTGQYLAHAWSGWDWTIERDQRKSEQWVVHRSREGMKNFRRWAAAENPRAACRLVTEART